MHPNDIAHKYTAGNSTRQVVGQKVDFPTLCMGLQVLSLAANH